MSRTACVISPVTTESAASVISAAFVRGVGLRVVHDERGQRLGHRSRRHDADVLRGQRVDLFGDRDDVLVVRQDHDVVGVDVLDRVEQFGRRRVHRLPTGHDALHAELGEQLHEPVAAAHRDDGRRAPAAGRRLPAERRRAAGHRRARAWRAPRRPPRTDRSPGSAAGARRDRAPPRSAAPMSLVCTWQFHRPSPPTTTIESPIAPHPCLKSSIRSSSRSRKYITS